MKTTSLLLAVAVVIAAPSRASAVERFPRDIQRTLSLSYEPPCRLCHIQGTTGSGTVETPFGFAMRARGLDAEQRDSLANSLAKMKTEKVDSDGDGVADVDELEAGADPNSPAAGARLDDDPGHGCSVGHGVTAWWALPLVAWFLLRRRRAES